LKWCRFNELRVASYELQVSVVGCRLSVAPDAVIANFFSLKIINFKKVKQSHPMAFTSDFLIQMFLTLNSIDFSSASKGFQVASYGFVEAVIANFFTLKIINNKKNEAISSK
jgi:hypothetical protein